MYTHISLQLLWVFACEYVRAYGFTFFFFGLFFVKPETLNLQAFAQLCKPNPIP